jgi:hypothetical protein
MPDLNWDKTPLMHLSILNNKWLLSDDGPINTSLHEKLELFKPIAAMPA